MSYQENYRRWLESAALSQEEKAELQAIAGSGYQRRIPAPSD